LPDADLVIAEWRLRLAIADCHCRSAIAIGDCDWRLRSAIAIGDGGADWRWRWPIAPCHWTCDGRLPIETEERAIGNLALDNQRSTTPIGIRQSNRHSAIQSAFGNPIGIRQSQSALRDLNRHSPFEKSAIGNRQSSMN
jgi:hypothetical protein